MSLTVLRNATVCDPTANPATTERDVWLAAGKIVAAPADGLAEREYDCTGCVILAGGIDMHSHIAGPKVNIARKLRPEDRRNFTYTRNQKLRAGTGGSTPTTFTTGYLYGGLGYTTAFDAAIPPLGARHALEEFHDTPIIDKGYFVLLGNNHYALELIQKRELEQLRHYSGGLLDATRGYAFKIVNPGGVERWKQGNPHDTLLDSRVGLFDVTPREIIQAISQTCMDLQLPHPVHIHANQLGIAGNWKTTLATMQALEGRLAHLTHIQFHSYGGGDEEPEGFCSRVPELAEYVNNHPNITVDVGHVSFGQTTSMTGDGALGSFLHKVTGRKWFNGETECEAGCGIVPIEYKEKSLIHALQWIIGLEWYLLVKDPWQVAMSTDHPNGGVFMAYPEMIRLLMSRDYREEVLQRLPKKIQGRCVLPDIRREYTLEEIAIISRAGPARLLGLPNKGSLRVGADADVVVLKQQTNPKEMFEMPKYVFKAGVLVCEEGDFRTIPFGPIHAVRPQFDTQAMSGFKNWFQDAYSIQYANFAVDDTYLAQGCELQILS